MKAGKGLVTPLFETGRAIGRIMLVPMRWTGSRLTQITALTVLSIGLAGCGHNYTAEEMAGAFKSESSPTIMVNLNSDGSSSTDFGGGTVYRGNWKRISKDGIVVETSAGGEMYYQIESKDRIKYLLNEEAIKLGVQGNPNYNRVK